MTNFWDALELVEKQPEPKELEYRLYYDVNGSPRFYTSDTTIEGDYIVVDYDTYNEGLYNVSVVNGKLVRPNKMIYKKLIPVTEGKTFTSKNDVSIIGKEQGWKIGYYE
jgi:hypothetical protein